MSRVRLAAAPEAPEHEPVTGPPNLIHSAFGRVIGATVETLPIEITLGAVNGRIVNDREHLPWQRRLFAVMRGYALDKREVTIRPSVGKSACAEQVLNGDAFREQLFEER